MKLPFQKRAAALAPRNDDEDHAAARRLLRWGGVLLAALVWTAALTREPRRAMMALDELDTTVVSTKEIKAAIYLKSVDLQKTREARDLAVATVPTYYRVDRERVESQLRALRERIDAIRQQRAPLESAVREALLESHAGDTKADLVGRATAQFVEKLLQDPAWAKIGDAPMLTLWLTPDAASVPDRIFAGQREGAGLPQDPAAKAEALSEGGTFSFTYGDRLADLASSGLEYALSQGVRAADLPPGLANKAIVILRDAAAAGDQVSQELKLGAVPDPKQAAELLAARLRDTAKNAARDTSQPAEWARLHEAALALSAPLIADTIRSDEVYTAGALERAKAAVEPVMKEIYPGENIQEAGHRWTPQSKEDVTTYLGLVNQEDRPWRRVALTGIAHLLLSVLVIGGLYRAAGLFSEDDPDEIPVRFDLALLLITGALIVGRTAFYFEPGGFVLPVAAVGILYAILVNSRLAAMVTLAAVLLVSAQYGYDWRLAVTGAAMSLTGGFAIFKVRRRGDMAGASIKATIVGVVAAAAVMLAVEGTINEAAIRRIAMVALNGGLCLLLVPALLSPLERLFGITTDITMLEYSDLNNELLTQLAIKAPGTYAHSQMLGILAEAAADAIGANGLRARVCAFYHDIGKMKRSEYFTENQEGYNIHNDIKPLQSARAIKAHVIQGAEMARERHLPKPIVDGILEHHGTMKIGNFYERALEHHKHGDIREEDFRYPGPRPQSPETAILMICDASESGVRSIKNPTEERVREFIQARIADRQADRQFDDCDLTLKQLDTIAEVIAQRLISTMHTRVAYPGARGNDTEDDTATGGQK